MPIPRLGMIEEIGRQVEKAGGTDAFTMVMSGVEELTSETNAQDYSAWVREAINRLDAALPQKTRAEIMEACGINCAEVNHSGIARGKARRAKFQDESAFLEAEIHKPITGTRLERDGDSLIQTYTPRTYTHPMRCYCALMSGLPEGFQVSPTYCNCSRGFVKTFWSEVLGRPVDVQILETALTGSTECRFKIKIR